MNHKIRVSFSDEVILPYFRELRRKENSISYYRTTLLYLQKISDWVIDNDEQELCWILDLDPSHDLSYALAAVDEKVAVRLKLTFSNEYCINIIHD
jgi:hypothetical protein